MPPCLDASSRWDMPFHHILRQSFTVLRGRWEAGHCLPVDCWRVWRFSRKIPAWWKGRTLVDPSGWKVPVLVSNFSQETVMVEPFSEVGMIAQVWAIQPTMNKRRHASCDPETLPEHLQGLLKRTSGESQELSDAFQAVRDRPALDILYIPGVTLETLCQQHVPGKVQMTGTNDTLLTTARAPILAFPTESGDYVLDTDASNFGLGGVLSQIQNGVECVIAYYSRALRPSQRKYCTTKREMLAVVSMCIQFRSCLPTLRTDHKSLVWLHRFKDTEGMLARWLHTLHQFQFTIVHWAGRDHGNADGLSRAPTDPCRQCTRVECPRVNTSVVVADQPFDDASVGDSEDDDLIPLQSGEDWIAQLDDDLSRPASQSGEVFSISALQREDPTCVTLLEWIRSDTFPPWTEVRSLCPELRFLWHHRNNLSVDTNGVLWRKRSSAVSQLQLLVPKPGRERLFLNYHATLIGGHLGRNRTLARLSQRFYWSGMADDVGDWLRNCTTCMKRKSPAGRHHPVGNIPTGHRWDRIAMDILDVCDPTPDGFRYILVIADYFSKWTEAFPIKNKCADTVADVLVDKIILRFAMPLVIHSDQGREFENGLMKSLCNLLGCVKTRTAPYHPESDGMVERFNRTCLMMLSMFVNDRRDNWHKLLPFVMHAYRTSVHESTGYSPYRLMMGEECSLPQDVNTEELRSSRENEVVPHPFAACPGGRIWPGPTFSKPDGCPTEAVVWC